MDIIKNPPIIEGGCLNNYNLSITLNDSVYQAPDIIKDIIKLYQKKFINLDDKIILNVLLAKLFQWLNFYRVKVYENDNSPEIIPNWFALVLAPSGYGKDMLLKDLTFYIVKGFYDRHNKHVEDYKKAEKEKIEEQAEEYDNPNQQKAFIKEAMKRIRHIEPETQNATCEGFYADCKTLNNLARGSVFIIINEFAGYLSPLTPDREQFLNCFFTAYDGVIESKSIKGENRDITITGMPVNALLYSDYSSFYKTSKEKTILATLLDRGLARRLVITFIVPDNNRKADTKTQQEKTALNSKSIELGNILNETFNKLRFGTNYRITESAYNNILCEYEKVINTEYNATDSETLKREILSRTFKVKKLACLYAVLNHIDTQEINENDILQAISTIEYLSADFEKMINYKPMYKDKYDKLFEFFVQNVGVQFSKMDLMGKYQQFGFKREDFRHKLDSEIKETLKEMALEKGYLFCNQPINNNTGNLYYLIENQNKNDTLVNPESLVNFNDINTFESYNDCNTGKSKNQTSKTYKTCKPENSTTAIDLQDLLDLQEVK